VKVRLDPARCTGHGRCYTLAPNVFDADEEGRCVVRAEEVRPAHEREARAAVINCPEDALAITAE
jgi:ferredoxin